MKILVAYYSRNGSTKKAAEDIAGMLNCDIEEIVDTNSRKGVLGFIFGGRDAMRKRTTVIKGTKMDPSGYDLIVLGTPVWASAMTPAIRTYILQNVKKLKNVALFCVCGVSGEKALKDMENLCEIRKKAAISFKTVDIRTGSFLQKAKEFVSDLVAG